MTPEQIFDADGEEDEDESMIYIESENNLAFRRFLSFGRFKKEEVKYNFTDDYPQYSKFKGCFASNHDEYDGEGIPEEITTEAYDKLTAKEIKEFLDEKKKKTPDSENPLPWLRHIEKWLMNAVIRRLRRDYRLMMGRTYYYL